MADRGLYWLPPHGAFAARARAAREGGILWPDLVTLARHDLDAIATDRVAKLRRQHFPAGAPAGSGTRDVRLALLGSLTLAQLEPGIIAGGLRRGLWVETYAAEFGQYLQEILEPQSGLAGFAPTHILFAFDARSATARAANAGSGKTHPEHPLHQQLRPILPTHPASQVLQTSWSRRHPPDNTVDTFHAGQRPDHAKRLKVTK